MKIGQIVLGYPSVSNLKHDRLACMISGAMELVRVTKTQLIFIKISTGFEMRYHSIGRMTGTHIGGGARLLTDDKSLLLGVNKEQIKALYLDYERELTDYTWYSIQLPKLDFIVHGQAHKNPEVFKNILIKNGFDRASKVALSEADTMSALWLKRLGGIAADTEIHYTKKPTTVVLQHGGYHVIESGCEPIFFEKTY